jgi:hypothetical protein
MSDEPKVVREILERDVVQDRCPKCKGELDTGWECNDCGFDAMYLALGLPEPKPESEADQ